MLLEKEKSCVVLIDVQEKLTPLVMEPDLLLKHCEWMLRLSLELQVPIIVSQQYTQGLGSTVSSLRTLISGQKNIEKISFSCFGLPDFQQHLQTLKKNQVILIGIETHVCVLQTALELQEAGYSVFVVVDAVSSRNEMDYTYGLKRMKQAGIQLVTTEMIFFEWLRKAGTPEFKKLSKTYLG